MDCLVRLCGFSDNRTWVTFTYFGSWVYKVTNLFRNTRVDIAFSTTNTVLHQLRPQKTIDASKTSGIYRLLCNTCNRLYVGQSGWTITVRYKEHIRFIRTNAPAPAYALHILNLSSHVMPFGIILLILFFICYNYGGLETVNSKKIVAFFGMERVNLFQSNKIVAF
jgi:hypothetical protein